MAPVPFLQLFRYASSEDLVLLGVANIFILYSSLNIPLVNIIYGLMMREMNDFVARREQFRANTTLPMDNIDNMNNYTGQSLTINQQHQPTQSIPFTGTFHDAQELFITNSYNLCMLVIVFGLTRFVALYLALLFFSIAASNQAKRVKLLFFKSLLRQEVNWFERNRTGDFAIRITSDLSKFEDGIGEKIALCLNALFAWMSSLISSFYYGWELTLVCLVLVPLTIFITTVIAEFQATYSMRENSALSRAFNVCHEVISSVRTVFAFSGEQKEADRFKQGLDSAYKYGLHRNSFAGLNLGFTWMSGYLGFAICLLYSTKFYKPEHYGLYDEAHIITILWSAAGCVFLLNRMMPFIEIIQMARGSASNLFSVIERQSQIDVTSGEGLQPKLLEADVRFNNVYFTYPTSEEEEVLSNSKSADERISCDEPDLEQVAEVEEEEEEEVSDELVEVNSGGSSGKQRSSSSSSDSGINSSTAGCGSAGTIKGLTLEVRAGQTIALVGPSGSGKSTALALLQRFYELDQGSITIGGHNLRDLNLAWLRSQLGVVTQEPVLFDMSIGDNIRLGAKPGQTVSDHDLEQAARAANAHAFISRLPQGYETRAGARGVQLSGGQKQRIAIARALVRQPKLLLLDEATSALDLESEAIVQKALDQARIGRTTFVVAHRLSTVRNADKIIVFDKGTVVETGTHEELLQLRGLYHQIHAQQRQGLDLAPPARRNSQLAGLSGVGGGGSLAMGGGANLVHHSASHHHLAPPSGGQGGQVAYGRESRSLSIYSTTGGFGAAGHGGNGEGVDNGPGQEDYYGRHHLEAEPEEEVSETSDEQPDALVSPSSGFRNRLLNDETQCSLLDGLSVGDGLIGGESSAPMKKSCSGSSSKTNRNNLSIWQVLKFIKPDLAYSLVGVSTSLLMGLCIPISAMIIGDLATIFSTDRPEEIRQGLYSHGLLYVGLAMFAFVVSFVQVLSFGVAGEKIGINLRLRGFQAILQRPVAWFDLKRNNPGAICTRLASDVGNVQSITGNRTAVIFQSISILVSTSVFALYFNLKFSAICATFVAMLLFSTVMQARYAGKLAVANRGFDSQIGKIVLESSANIKTLVSLHQEDYFIERCQELLERDRRAKSLDNHLRLSLESLKYAMTAVSKGSSFYFAARMLLHDEITIDVIFKLIEIILYGLTEASKSLIFISDLQKARRGTQNLYKLIKGAREQQQQQQGQGEVNKGITTKERSYLPRFLVAPKVSAAASRRQELASWRHPHQDPHHAQYKSLPSGDLSGVSNPLYKQQQPFACVVTGGHNEEPAHCKGQLQFHQVRFHYPSRPDACVLKSLSLDIKAGQSVALVGRSGCGKSTIVQLLERFYDHSQGDISLDGTSLRRLPLHWLRRQIGLVQQEPSLLSYTIGDNIRYGDNSRHVTMEEVVRAAQVANIHDFIMSLPDQYDTKLSESNSLQLSGGQKQRIAIARALVRRAPILVFDEATSALDTKSEQLVQAALEKAQEGRTSIIIAHRLSAVKAANSIVVLKEGVVVEQGSHQELLERRGEYYSLYKSQSARL